MRAVLTDACEAQRMALTTTWTARAHATVSRDWIGASQLYADRFPHAGELRFSLQRRLLPNWHLEVLNGDVVATRQARERDPFGFRQHKFIPRAVECEARRDDHGRFLIDGDAKAGNDSPAVQEAIVEARLPAEVVLLSLEIVCGEQFAREEVGAFELSELCHAGNPLVRPNEVVGKPHGGSTNCNFWGHLTIPRLEIGRYSAF